uniref:Cytochrome P450 94C80 n=1 Tax=Reynoutria sachalinensis TaxID=76036 RepID=A0A140JTI5_9CARY|nr:cytochrome P450 94C80 [Fallopia sachalinensis]
MTDPSSHWFLLYSTIFITLFFSLISAVFFRYNRRLSCKCDTCRCFVARGWTCSFPSLPDWYTHLLRRSPTSTIQIHVLCNTVTANADNVEYMLKTNFSNYPKGRPHSVILGDLLGRGIFVVDGHHWRFQRKLASLELGSLSVRSFALDILSSEIRVRLLPLFSHLAADGSPADLQDLFRRFAFDNICRFSFGVDPACLGKGLPVSEFAEAFDLASRLSAERALEPAPAVWKVKRALNLGSEKRLKEALDKVNVLAETIIRERRKLGFSTRKDLLSRFMASITDEKYLRDIVISFLLAGRDTVASAITVFFLLVAQNPDVESKIREESDRVMGQEDRAQLPTFDQLKGLHYLHGALHEALRLYPPVQIDSKYADMDDVLPDGTRIRKGDKVSFHPYAMGRMPQIWGPDCLEFRPERWLDKNGLFCPVNLFKYPVFQAGFRVCLGKEMALVSMKIVCLSIVRSFDVRLAGPVGPPQFVPGLSATLKGGLHAVVRKRE